MATAGLIGCGPRFRALPGGFDEEPLNLFDDDIFSTSIFKEVVGSSEAICRVTAQVMRVALSGATVLITGESGTGKEWIARAIHKKSRRSRSIFTKIELRCHSSVERAMILCDSDTFFVEEAWLRAGWSGARYANSNGYRQTNSEVAVSF
jgi:hypothetical protein